MTSQEPLLLEWFNFNPSRVSNSIYYIVWDEITYPFPNFNGCTNDVWESISNFIPHFTGHVITYPYWDQRQTMLVKGAPDRKNRRINIDV